MASGLNLLPILVAIIEEKHMGRAAARLGMSQPAISRSLQALREEYEDQMVIRKASGVEPTNFAMEIYPVIKAALGTLSDTYERKKVFDPKAAHKTFTIACTSKTSLSLMAPLIRKIRKISTTTHLNMLPLYSDDFLADLRTMKLDGIIDADKSDYHGLSKSLLYKDRMVLVCSKSHPRIFGDHISLHQYLDEQHVIVSHGPSQTAYLSPNDIKELSHRKIAMSAAGAIEVFPIVGETDLIGLASERNIKRFGDIFNVKQVTLPFEKTEFDICFFWHSQRKSDQAHRWLRQFIIDSTSRF